MNGRSKRITFILGLVHAVAMMFLFGLSLANVLIQLTWLDMRADLGALIPFLTLSATVFYLLNRYFVLDGYLFWEKKWFYGGMVPFGILVTLAIHRFDLERLSIVPAVAVREGWGWSQLSLASVNIIILAMLGLAGLMLVLFKNQLLEGRKRMTKQQKVSLWLLLIPSFLFIGLYLIQPGVRFFINDAAAILASADIEAFRNYLLSFGIWAPILSAVLMIFQSVIAPLPAFVITFANGMLFGAFWGGILSWSSAMLGAALCYGIARALGRPVVEKLVSKTAVEWTDQFFERYGKHSILLARLLPIVSFDLVSYGAGLTSMRFWGFWLATGIGQAPATILYSYLGQTASGSVKILFWVFVVVICLGIILAAWKKRSSYLKLQDTKQQSV